MEKNGQLAVGSSPCERCGRASETRDDLGQLLCMSCYLKAKPGPAPETLNTKTVKMAADHSGEK